MELVPSRRLAEVFRVSPFTLDQWHQGEFLLQVAVTKGEKYYNPGDIDEILQRGAKNLTRPLSSAAILTGTIKLLTLGQAAQMMMISPHALQYRIDRGSFPAIRLRAEWRVIEEDVNDFLRRNNAFGHFRRELAAHIFGFSLNFVKERIHGGDLRCVTISGKPVVRPVTIESILALLRKLAPSWVDPVVWVMERQGDMRPLLGIHEFERYLGLVANTGKKVLVEEKVAYLQTKPRGGIVGISPVSADRLLAQQEVLTLRQIGNLFLLDERAIEAALQANRLRCRLHTHPRKKLRRACVLELLRHCLSPGVKQKTRWYEEHLNYSEPSLSIPEAASFYKTSEEQIVSHLQGGKLHGVILPGSAQWRITKDYLIVI